MPKITAKKILILPEDRDAISEQSPGIDPSTFVSIFNTVINNGDTTQWFKLLEEISEKDSDVLHALETRSSMIISKEWTIEGENETQAQEIEDILRNIKGDPTEGLLTFEQMLKTLLGPAYLIGLSLNEIVTDSETILGFNHIPSKFLTFRESTFYPKLWTRESQTGVEINKKKMISHYLTCGNDPARGYLGLAVGWLYVLKRMSLEQRLTFANKYSKGFLLINMPGDKDSYLEAWATAKDLIENYSTVDGAVFPADVIVDFKEAAALNGDYFFQNDDDLKTGIVKIILGQDSTSDSTSSNRSTAEVHLDILESRILEDINLIENTITNQLISKIKTILGVPESSDYRFKFIMGEMEATMDEDLDVEEIQEDVQETEVVEE